MISMRSVVHTWACHRKGPVYVAMFNPLGIIIALAMGVIFLGDTVYLGRYLRISRKRDKYVEIIKLTLVLNTTVCC